MSWFGPCIAAPFYIFGVGLGAVVALETILGTPDLNILGLGEDAITRLFAVLGASVFVGLNYRGTKITGRSETAVTLVLLSIVSAFIAFAFVRILSEPFPSGNYTPFFRGSTGFDQFVALVGAMGFTFIVFEG